MFQASRCLYSSPKFSRGYIYIYINPLVIWDSDWATKTKIPQTGWLKQQKQLFSHSFGGWEVHDHGAGKFGSWWEPSFWLTLEVEMADFSLPVHEVERGSSGVSSNKRHEFHHWGLTPMMSSKLNWWHLSKASPLNTIASGSRAPKCEFGGTQTSNP